VEFNFKKWQWSLLKTDEKILFFDLGANKGEVTEKFINYAKNYKAYLFEANSNLCRKLRIRYFDEAFLQDNIEIFENIVGVNNDLCKFLIGLKRDCTNSMVESVHKELGASMRKFNRSLDVDVESIDISKFILDKIKNEKHDIVIVKMDIEGSEWKVIDKMILDGTFKKVDVLLIEYHGIASHLKEVHPKIDIYDSNKYNKLIYDASEKVKIYQERGHCSYSYTARPL